MNNTIVLESCLQEFKSKNELHELRDSDAFELFALLQVTKEKDLSFNDIEDSIVDGGNDGGIDSLIILVDETYISDLDQLKDIKITCNSIITLYVSQSKFENSFKETALDKIYISIPVLFDLTQDETQLLNRFNASLVEKIMIFRKIWLLAVSKGVKPNIFFTYICKANSIEKNSSFDDKTKQIKNITKDSIKGGNVDFNLYSAEQLIELFQQPRKMTRMLRFKENPIPIPFSEDEFGYIGVVSLGDYYQFITDENRIVESIFESNVRHFQGNVDVNQKIRDSLKDEFSRDFWWLNNGITIISSQCVPMPKALSLTNVQIVNGLQTSFTIGNYYNKTEMDKRSILVKIIISKDRVTIDKVISATNSQTPVSPAILRATEDLQRNIELYFLGKGYFYDRRKNYYKNLGKPAKKIFNIQTTAQAVEAIMNFNPSMARSAPTKLIKDKKYYKKIFDSRMHFQVYLTCCLIYQQVKRFINSSLESDEKNFVRNFVYHLSRTVASFITAKGKYQVEDIVITDCSNISPDIIRQAYEFFVQILEEYQVKNAKENIINIAKSKKFSEELNNKLKETFAKSIA